MSRLRFTLTVLRDCFGLILLVAFALMWVGTLSIVADILGAK